MQILSEARATVALALPIIGTQLAQMAIHTTDVLLLARYSEASLGGAALGMALFYILWVMALGLSMATPAIAAQALGRSGGRDADDRQGVRHAVHDGLILTGLFGLIAMGILWASGPIFRLAGQPPDLIEIATPFLQTLSFSMIPTLWFVVLRSFMAALERPRAAMLLMVLAIALNAGVNYVLVFGGQFWGLGIPALGAVGAGIGSSAVNTVILIALGWLLGRDAQFHAYRLLQGWWRSNAIRLKAYLRIGAPIALTLGAEVGLFSIAAILMGRLGAAEVAAHQLALQLASIAFMVPMGLSQAATVRVGLAAGANDAAGVARAGWVAVTLSLVFACCSALLLWQFSGYAIALFLPDRSGPVFGLAVGYLAWAALFQLVDGTQATANGALRGLKDTAIPMLMACFGYWIVGLGVAVWFGFFTPMRGNGIWLGLASGLAVVALLLVWRFQYCLRKLGA